MVVSFSLESSDAADLCLIYFSDICPLKVLTQCRHHVIQAKGVILSFSREAAVLLVSVTLAVKVKPAVPNFYI